MLERLGQSGSGRRFISELLQSAVAEARDKPKPRGCLVMNTANEFAQRDPQVATWARQGVDRFKAIFEAAVRLGQREGDISSERDPETLALYLVTSMSGIKTIVRAGVDERAADNIVQVILSALD